MPLPTEEQTMLREMAHNWAAQNAPVRALRELRDSGNEQGFDSTLFADIAEMGWTGCVISQTHGGSDFGLRSMGIVLEELGRTLVAAPLLGNAVGAACALELGGTDEQKSQWLPRIAAGEAIGALAIDEADRYRPEHIALSAELRGNTYVLQGTKRLVHEGMSADLYVVAARTRGSAEDQHGVSLFLVPSDCAGLQRHRRQLLDSRGYADIEFEQVEVPQSALLGEVDNGRSILDPVLDRTTAVIAAEQFGLALQAFETTLDYLKTRVQFGQVIGTFQALQHRAARLFTDIQLTRPCIEQALYALDENLPEAPTLVSLAKTTANDLAHTVSREMIQLHGGIGMTDAHDAGFYIKRSRALEAAFGNSAYHRERYARLKGI